MGGMNMDLYSMTLGAIAQLLRDVNKDSYAAVVDECIEKWQKTGNCRQFGREFNPTGRLADLKIDNNDVADPEEGYWIAQTFSALVALSAHFADLSTRGLEPDVGFLRKNFGVANDYMEANVCEKCGSIEVTAADIDKYISKGIISKHLVDGLENGDLNEEVKKLTSMEQPEIGRERRKTRLRLENTSVKINPGYGKLVMCSSCGSEKIKEKKLLKSLKDNVFIPLNS